MKHIIKHLLKHNLLYTRTEIYSCNGNLIEITIILTVKTNKLIQIKQQIFIVK